MESRSTILLFAAIAALLCLCQVAPVLSQDRDLPLCSEFRRNSADQKLRLFRNANGVAAIEDHLCLNSRNRVRRFYSCPKGYTAFVPSRDNSTTLTDFRRVLNIRTIALELGKPPAAILICIPPRPPTTTPTPEPVETQPTPPALSSCPSGPTRVNEYLRQDQDQLCKFSCSFGTAVFGIPTGTVTREVFRCCEGEPKIVSRALRLYSCPDSNQS